MNRVFGSLTNRIFLAAALLAVATIGVAVFVVNTVVTRQAERELIHPTNDTSTLVIEASARRSCSSRRG